MSISNELAGGQISLKRFANSFEGIWVPGATLC